MSSATKTLPSRLADIVGAPNVIEDPRELANYAVDGKNPGAAARPATAQEIAEIAKFAVAEKLAMIPCGSRTKLGIGMPPSRYDLAIDLSRMIRIISHDPGDLTLSVEPGISLARLAESLAAHNQFLPLVVPFFDRATVGGTLASGVDSLLRQFYGTARDFVLGMEFVTGDGALAKSGGRVVKNVSGYDLHKLMLGSLGSLGIITRVNFKTFPLPAARRGYIAVFDSLDPTLALRSQIARSPFSPGTLEVISPAAARLLAEKSPCANTNPLASAARWLSGKQWVLLARIEGSASILDRSRNDLSHMASDAGAIETFWLDDSECTMVWNRLREAIPTFLNSSPCAAIMKISAASSDLDRLFGFLTSVADECALPHAALARGAGIIYMALLPESADEKSLQGLKQACARILQASESMNVQATIPWCPPELKRVLSIWGPPRPDFPLHQRVKQSFDPHNIFAPGRFVGGL